MEIKNIVVCGDSFSSADKNLPGTHYSELLSNMGFNVRNLARGGITNTAICFQIQEAIKLNADLVIFTSTSPDRLDIPIGRFDPSLGLKNFVYTFQSDSSTGDPLVGDVNAPIYSDVVPSLLGGRPDAPKHLITDEHLLAIKYYLTFLHSSELKNEVDTWIIQYWTSKIKCLNLKTSTIGKPLYNYVKQHPDKRQQAVYHTDIETQEKVAFDIKNYIDKTTK